MFEKFYNTIFILLIKKNKNINFEHHYFHDFIKVISVS